MTFLGKLALCAALALPLSSQASEWTESQKKWAVAATVLHIVDWGQTRHIAKNPHKFHELNPILGKHPSVGKVDAYFVLTGIGMGALAHSFPKYRNVILKTYVVVQGVNTARNFHIGLKVDF